MERIKNILDPERQFLIVITVVNGGNYLLNILLGRWLVPEQFAEVGLLSAIVLGVSFIALGFQLTAAKYRASDSDGLESGIMDWIKTKTLLLSLILMALGIFFSGHLATILNLDAQFSLIVISACLPMYFLMSVERGRYLGQFSYMALSMNYFIEASVRFASTVIFVLISGWPIGVSIAIGFFLSFLISWIQMGNVSWNWKLRITNLRDEHRVLVKFFIGVVIFELSQVLINHGDLFVVKHLFSNEIAGLYSALSLIGRMVFYATWMIVMVMIPRAIESKKEGIDPRPILYGALIIAGSIGSIAVITMLNFGTGIVEMIYGVAYLQIADLLSLYAMATVFFSCANIFAYYAMSMDNYIPVVVTIIAGILQVVVIYFNAQDLESVVLTQVFTMGLLLSTLLLNFILFNKNTIQHEDRISISLSAE